MSVVPKDNRKYKDQTIDNIVNVHTFSPRINPLTQEIAKKRELELINLKKQIFNSNDETLTFLDKYNLQMM